MRPLCRSLALIAALGPLAAAHGSREELALPGAIESTPAQASVLALTPAPARLDGSAAPDGCRQLAAASLVHVGAALGQLSCRFDAERAALDCQLSAGSASARTRSEYASVDDFVEAGRELGKITSLRELETTQHGERVTTHDFDELGRLRRATETDARGSRVYLYSDYDDQGRPHRASPSLATRADAPCEAPAFGIDYDDGRARVEYHYQPPSSCAEADFRVIEQYDALGNRVRVQREAGGRRETTFEAGAAADTQLVCTPPLP